MSIRAGNDKGCENSPVYSLVVEFAATKALFFYHKKDGSFFHAWYEITASPDELVRMGLCELAPQSKCGITPCGQVRAGGRVFVQRRTHIAIERDRRFLDALERLKNGAPYPDVRLPPAPKGSRPKRSAAKRSERPTGTATATPAAPSRTPDFADAATQCALALLGTLHQKLHELGLTNSTRLADQIRKEIEYREATRDDDDGESRVG
jgi:hypothetical protein